MNEPRLHVRKLRGDAALPTRANEGDAGLDLASCETVRIEAGSRATVATGLALEIPDGYAGLVVPRSGLAMRHGLTLVNTPGVIDAGYRGEVRVIVLNTDREHSFTVEPGMRIAQLLVVPALSMEVVEVEELAQTARGEDGFGSSGVR